MQKAQDKLTCSSNGDLKEFQKHLTNEIFLNLKYFPKRVAKSFSTI